MASPRNTVPLGARPKTFRTNLKNQRSNSRNRGEPKREFDSTSNNPRRTSGKLETKSDQPNSKTQHLKVKDDSGVLVGAKEPRPKGVSRTGNRNTTSKQSGGTEFDNSSNNQKRKSGKLETKSGQPNSKTQPLKIKDGSGVLAGAKGPRPKGVSREGENNTTSKQNGGTEFDNRLHYQRRTSGKLETKSGQPNSKRLPLKLKNDSAVIAGAKGPRPKGVSREDVRNTTPRRNGGTGGLPPRNQHQQANQIPHNHHNNGSQISGTYDGRKSYMGRGRGRINNASSTGRFPHPGRRGRRLDDRRLKDLLNQESTEIVMELATEKNGFKELLGECPMNREMIILLLEIMAKACLCASSPKNLNSFLAFIRPSAFLSQHLTQFVSSLLRDGNTTEEGLIELQPVRHLIALLNCLLQHLRSSSSEVGPVAILLESVCRVNKNIPDEIKEQVTGIKETYEMLEKSGTAQAERAMLKNQYKAPPNNFREIYIIPGIKELRKDRRPFLRHNLIKGQYENVDHYLDVQFRLLREDFVAPLREGIAEYLHNQEEFGDDQRRRLQDVRLYHGVSIIRPTMTRGGPGHLIEFDTTSFQKIRWESSKRLINGSLLCLTQDDFQSVIYATVEGRDVRKLQNGRIEVKFMRLPDVLGISSDVTFLMAETSAYFESYRYVLGGLQEYNEDNLPMKSYIVDASSQSTTPIYLHDTEPRYDLRPLVQGKDEQELATPDAHVLKIHSSLRAVKVLEPGTWPDAETLHFDESQLEAYRAALSSEFVLIQGPPGTGKTYVGLEIVKTLLFNFYSWCFDEVEEKWDSRPILVVCYTNHALDQFLEGIYKYEKGVVRVGGRCLSESLQDCSIASIRKKMKDNRNVPGHVRNRRADMQEYYDMRDILDAAHERISLAQTGILRAIILYDKAIIPFAQYKSLLSHTYRGGDPMFDWLGLDGKGLPKVQSKRRSSENQDSTNGDSDEDDSDDEFHIMEEAEILAEQRQLGNDPTFIKHREERIIKLFDEFTFLPGKPRSRTESRTEKQDRRRFEKTIEFAINHPDVAALEMEDIPDVWQIPYHQRWKLYRHWLAQYIRLQEEIMLRYQTAFEQLSEQRKEIDREEDYLILKEARVIGMTTTGAAKNRILLQRVCPKIIVVEEAAEVLEAHIITTLSKNCQHLILIGDHQQLRPNPTVYRLAKSFKLDVSLFERMINNGLPCYRLGLQHRMRPEISVLMKEHFYKGLDDHDSVMHYKPIMGVTKNMFFLEHGHKELQNHDTKSKSNLHEAQFLVELCQYFLKQGYERSQITILTTYTGQLLNFKKLMDKEKYEGVRVSVVDNYQGEENDIILLSLVRSNEEGSIGFLKVANRVCVALSRAREGLFCIGNVRLLAEQSDLWKGIVNTITESGQIGTTLPLVCQNHPDTITNVSCKEEFVKVPDGGCNLRCDVRLDCGHACALYCHPKDPKHEEYKCMKACSTVCPRGHKCTLKCFEECNCPKILKKLFEKCQHTGNVQCHNIETATCQRPCSEKLSCKHKCPSKCGEDCPETCEFPCEKKSQCGRGHKCRKKCGRPCTSKFECWEPVEVQRPKCKHIFIVKCKDNPISRPISRFPPCTAPCERPLKCGHKCYNMCKDRCQTECKIKVTKTWTSCDHSAEIECQNSATAVCRELCRRSLPCGHKCRSKCKDPCETKCTVMVTKKWPTCEHSIEIQCQDATNAVCRKPCQKMLPCRHRCIKPCGEPCEPTKCSLPCPRLLIPCKHSCRKKCGELCEPSKCASPCRRLLPCSHQCLKKCGEPCDTHCTRQMLKTVPECEHVVKVPCYVDVKDVECNSACGKTLSCGHVCKGICGKPCTVTCQAKTVKVVPKCGHKITLPCNQEPKHDLCKEKCSTIFQCGHFCQQPCGQKCEEACGMRVNKELPACRHVHNMPCVTDPKDVKCDSPCENVLLCGHKCVAKCGEPCTHLCQAKVTRQHPKCGHQLHLLCHEDVEKIICKEPCISKRPCGHNCSKMCFEPCKTETDAFKKQKKENGGWSSKFLDLYYSLTSAEWPTCKATVTKTHPKCGHAIKLSCSENPASIQCQMPCKEKLSCGHLCPNLCAAPCGNSKCKVIVDKKNPRCGHITKMSCHEDPSNSICQQPCGKKRSCGHPCLKLCSEPCETPGDVCQVAVTQQLRGCGHEVKLKCHEDPERVLCQKPCKKKLRCEHKCRNSCWQECETKCREKVHKVIKKCGHTAKVPCHLDPDSGQLCVKKCKESLSCGHPCEEKCGKPCTKFCKVKVRKILPSCNHWAKDVSCHQDPYTIVCKERCNKILSCGHDCKNVCGECSHSGKATATSLSRCTEKCRKILRCGHQCPSICGNCYGGRIHQPCHFSTTITLVCGCSYNEECSKVLSAIHDPRQSKGFCLLQHRPRQIAHRRNSEQAQDNCQHNSSPGYCEEPCQKLLPCNHTCIGICGEPCLKLCRYCNRRQVLQIFPEFKAERDPCYIQLHQCGHIFETTELNQKLNVSLPFLQSKGCVPIVPISCPKCKIPIDEKRFNEHAQHVTEDVEVIAKRLRNENMRDQREAEMFLSQSTYRYTQQPPRQGRVDRKGYNKKSSRSQRKARADMVWKLRLLDFLNTVDRSPLPKRTTICGRTTLIKQCQDMKESVLPEIRRRLERMLDDEISLTEQLADDLGCELERLQWCSGFESLILTVIDTNSALNTYRTSVERAVEIITSPRRFTVDRRQEVIDILGRSLYNKLACILRRGPRDLDTEKLLDLQKKQQGFLVGDWFKCPRDHIFHYCGHHTRSQSAGQSTVSDDNTPSCSDCEKLGY